jgi:hypothetical protein
VLAYCHGTLRISTDNGPHFGPSRLAPTDHRRTASCSRRGPLHPRFLGRLATYKRQRIANCWAVLKRTPSFIIQKSKFGELILALGGRSYRGRVHAEKEHRPLNPTYHNFQRSVAAGIGIFKLLWLTGFDKVTSTFKVVDLVDLAARGIRIVRAGDSLGYCPPLL